jgi:hypothetical protein
MLSSGGGGRGRDGVGGWRRDWRLAAAGGHVERGVCEGEASHVS